MVSHTTSRLTSKHPWATRLHIPLMPSQGNLGIASDKFAVPVHNSGGGLADDDEAHHHCLLSSLIGKKILFAHSINKRRASIAAVSI